MTTAEEVADPHQALNDPDPDSPAVRAAMVARILHDWRRAWYDS